MKKVQITLFLIVMIVITIFACGCSQDTSEFGNSTPDIAELPPYTVFTDGDYTYNVYSDHAELVGYTGKSTTGKIAEKADGKPVTVVGSGAFEGTNISSVTIPSSVKEIGAYAFYKTKLSSITIPETVKSLGYAAFGKTKLTEVTVPASITKLENSVFTECSELTKVILPDSLTYIGEHAFEKCSALTSVTIPAKVTVIDKLAFYNCSALTEVIFADNSEL